MANKKKVHYMILGFIIFSRSIDFISFEHYFDNFMRYISSKPNFFEFMDNTKFVIAVHEFEKIKLEFFEVSDDIVIGIVYPAVKPLNLDRRDQLIELATAVSQGDKNVTHNVLKSRYASDILSI